MNPSGVKHSGSKIVPHSDFQAGTTSEGKHKILLGKPEGTHPCGRLNIRWEDNVIRGLKEVDYEGDWKAPVQDRVAWRAFVLAARNLRVP